MVASDPIRFLGFAEWLQGATGMNNLVAELLAVCIILLMFMIPIMFLKANSIILMNLSILLLGAFTAIGWLPYYTWLVLGLYVAIEVSGKMKGWF